VKIKRSVSLGFWGFKIACNVDLELMGAIWHQPGCPQSFYQRCLLALLRSISFARIALVALDRRNWALSFAVGTLLVLLIAVGMFILLVSQQ
jgi:hypothetical protein